MLDITVILGDWMMSNPITQTMCYYTIFTDNEST